MPYMQVFGVASSLCVLCCVFVVRVCLVCAHIGQTLSTHAHSTVATCAHYQYSGYFARLSVCVLQLFQCALKILHVPPQGPRGGLALVLSITIAQPP